MYIYLMVLIISCTSSLCNILLKKFQKETKETFLTVCMLNIVNALTACIFFTIVNKFKININVPTLIFSIIAIFIVAGNIILNLFALKNSSLAFVSIIITSGSLIGTTIFGKTFLNEIIKIRLILAIMLTVTAVSLPFITEKIKNKQNNKTSTYNNKNIIICTLLFILSALSVILNKLYAINKNVCDSNSYFFTLNFLLILIFVSVLCVYKIKSKIPLKQIICALTLKQSSYIMYRTLISNCGAVITMIVLTKMDVSFYTMLTTSIALFLNTLASRYIFKEKMPFENKIAVLLTVLSICLAV